MGYDLSRIYMSATHTHCSVGGWANSWIGHQFAGEFNQQIVNDLTNSIIITIKKAEKELVIREDSEETRLRCSIIDRLQRLLKLEEPASIWYLEILKCRF